MIFNYRKIASVLASAAMLSSTMGFAAAATYPAPFVVGGSANAAIVVGANAHASDWAAAVDLSSDLGRRVSGTTTTTTTTGGDAKSLASGSDLVYLNDDLAENVATITNTDLKTVLTDGTFTDDGGVEYEYEQTINIGTSTSNGLAFSDSGNDLDNPVVLVEMTTAPSSTPVMTLNVNFNKAVPFNATDSKGEAIVIFGKEYTVGTATDGDTLVLLGGASETTVNVGEKVTVEVSGTSYEVSLNAISDASTPVASISINGESKTFTEGQTKKVSGIDVYSKTVFRSGDNAGYVIIQLGSDKLTFENGQAVMIGTDNDDIEGTYTTITGTVGAMTKLAIAVAAPDSDSNHILQGESFKDPVFGTLSLDFVDLKNGPLLEEETDTSDTRTKLGLAKNGDRELGMLITLPGQSEKTVPFVYQGALKDEDGKVIHVVEGENIDDEEYFILNSGNYQYFMQLTKVSLDETANSDVQFKDVITGNTYNDLVKNNEDLNQTAGTTTTFTIDSQTFTVTAVDADTVTITSSDYSKAAGGTVAVFPYLGLVDGKDVLVALAEDVTITNLNATTLQLPTGTITLPAGNTTAASALVGTVYYNVTSTATTDTTRSVTIGLTADNAAGARYTYPSLIFVEEEDKTEATANTMNAVILHSTDDGTHSEAATPAFTGTASTEYDTDTFDDTDFVGYLTNFGTYVVKDSSDTDQTMTWLTYSANGQQMYSELFVSEVGASISPGSTGSGGIVQVYKDSEVDMFSSKNIVVVGGSCINSAAAKILDSTSPLCGAEFTAKTNVGAGQYLIQSVASPYNEAKVALLVAGYETADTVNAVGKVKEGVTTDVGTSKVYPELSS